MQKSKFNLMFIGLSVLGLLGIGGSGILLINPDTTKASSFCEAKVTCPDGRPLICKGSSCSTDDTDPNNPTCTADGKTKKCSDPVEKNDNTKKDKKNKDKKKDNSNVNNEDVKNTNTNTQ